MYTFKYKKLSCRKVTGDAR